jgi:RNA polymerase sigma factor (sigma-70 family)
LAGHSTQATLSRIYLYWVVESSTSTLEESNDRLLEILKGCQKQRRESQKLLYQEFYGYGMSICLPYADNRDEAAEILNDGFMKLFNNIRHFDLKKPLKPWLRAILVNTSINHYRQKQRTIQAENMDHANQESEAESIISGISYQEIIAMLQKLPPAYRMVFNLYVIEGYKHEEIAQMLGISVGTSKSNLFKAKESLRTILNDFFETDYVKKK